MEREDRKLENLILRIMMYLKLEIQYDYLDWETFKKKKKKISLLGFQTNYGYKPIDGFVKKTQQQQQQNNLSQILQQASCSPHHENTTALCWVETLLSELAK